MDYAFVKLIHQTTVALSITGFVVRGVAALAGAGWVRHGLARSLPPVLDSVLLLSALTLAWMAQLTPDRAPWLVAKLIGLVAYIGLGVVALRPNRPLAVRAGAFAAALLVVGWMVSVAIIKQPVGFLAGLL
jgi:uncharacterized membrane protein SirB2